MTDAQFLKSWEAEVKNPSDPNDPVLPIVSRFLDIVDALEAGFSYYRVKYEEELRKSEAPKEGKQ